jgi:hypothetical protein
MTPGKSNHLARLTHEQPSCFPQMADHPRQGKGRFPTSVNETIA